MTTPQPPREQHGQEDGPRWLRDLQRWMDGLVKDNNRRFIEGTGTPEAAVTARVGALYTRLDGGASTTLYVKESGTGATGWVAK